MSSRAVGKQWHVTGDRVFNGVVYTLIAAILILVAYPLIYIVSSSSSSTSAVMAGRVWLYPVDFSLSGYKAIFENKDILTGYINTMPSFSISATHKPPQATARGGLAIHLFNPAPSLVAHPHRGWGIHCQ